MRLGVKRASTLAALAAAGLALAAYAALPGVRRAVDPAVGALATADPQAAVAALRAYLLGFGAWAPAASAALMVLQAVAAPLPAFVVTFANGLLFGWAWGALLSWASALAGAALCFGLARALGRPAVERLLGGRAGLEAADQLFARHGRSAILVARLLPFVPFDAVSYGAGLTATAFWPFLLATAVGQLPATLAYSWLGERMTGSVRVLFWGFSVALAVMVLGGAGGLRLLRRAGRRPAGGPPESAAP